MAATRSGDFEVYDELLPQTRRMNDEASLGLHTRNPWLSTPFGKVSGSNRRTKGMRLRRWNTR